MKRGLASAGIMYIPMNGVLIDPYLYEYILQAVTEGLSYTYLKTKLNMPCGKDMYYDRYRKFSWLLGNSRK